MSFTYSTDLDSDRDRVRFFIGDTISGSGPKPDGSNLTNEEIDALVTLAGTWQGAAALALRGLSSSWTNESKSLKIGPYSVSYTDRARLYADKASEIEKQMASTWTGLFSFHGQNSNGDDIGHMFGKTQWGASPTDWTE